MAQPHLPPRAGPTLEVPPWPPAAKHPARCQAAWASAALGWITGRDVTASAQAAGAQSPSCCGPGAGLAEAPRSGSSVRFLALVQPRWPSHLHGPKAGRCRCPRASGQATARRPTPGAGWFGQGRARVRAGRGSHSISLELPRSAKARHAMGGRAPRGPSVRSLTPTTRQRRRPIQGPFHVFPFLPFADGVDSGRQASCGQGPRAQARVCSRFFGGADESRRGATAGQRPQHAAGSRIRRRASHGAGRRRPPAAQDSCAAATNSAGGRPGAEITPSKPAGSELLNPPLGSASRGPMPFELARRPSAA